MELLLYIGAVVLLAAALIVYVAYALSRSVYACKSCGGTFRITLRRALFIQHVDQDYILTCPHCGKKGWCRRRPPEKEKAGD